MPSPRWRKQSKALRRAQSSIMLSLNLPQIRILPHAIAAGAAGAQKGGLPCPKGRPQIGGTMPKSHPRRNAMGGRNGRFRMVFPAEIAGIDCLAEFSGLEQLPFQKSNRFGSRPDTNRRIVDHG